MAPHPAEGEPPLLAIATVSGDQGNRGPWSLPLTSTVTLGRKPGAGLALKALWASRVVATFTYRPPAAGLPGYWVIRNGDRCTLEVKNKWAVEGIMRPNAYALLHAGTWDLVWRFDRPLSVQIVIAPNYGQRSAPPALDAFVDPAARAEVLGTDVGGARLQLSPLARHRLAIIYEHVILGTNPPSNVIEHARERLGGIPRQRVLNTITQVREHLENLRVDVVREGTAIADLGEYLVNVACVIGVDDLEP